MCKEIAHDVKFWFEAKILRPRPECLEAEAKFLASRLIWPRGFNIIEQNNHNE